MSLQPFLCWFLTCASSYFVGRPSHEPISAFWQRQPGFQLNYSLIKWCIMSLISTRNDGFGSRTALKHQSATIALFFICSLIFAENDNNVSDQKDCFWLIRPQHTVSLETPILLSKVLGLRKGFFHGTFVDFKMLKPKDSATLRSSETVIFMLFFASFRVLRIVRGGNMHMSHLPGNLFLFFINSSMPF